MPSTEKQLIGSRSRASGAAFEKLIETSCEVYKSRGLAYIEKTPEPMRPISRADRQANLQQYTRLPLRPRLCVYITI